MRSPPHASLSCPQPSWIRDQFNRIAPQYDRVNRLLTFGMVGGWRQRMLRAASPRPAAVVLDLCAGTGELARLWLRTHPDTARVVLLDFAERMLAQAPPKFPGQPVQFVVGDALHLPFPEAVFDTVLCGFSLRNVGDWRQAIAEMYRVLKPGGEALILEMCKEPWPLPVAWFIRRAVPFLGRLFSRDPSAYAWVPESIDRFASGEEVVEEMQATGFTDLRRHDMIFRVSTALVGRKG